MVDEPIAIWPPWVPIVIVLTASTATVFGRCLLSLQALSREGPVSLVLDRSLKLGRRTVTRRRKHFILLTAGALALLYVKTQGQSRKCLHDFLYLCTNGEQPLHFRLLQQGKAGPNRDLCVFVCHIRYPQYPQDYASYPPNLFQYGGPQYAPQMYGAPSALSPGSGPVYPYGSFTTQPLQGAPVYPGSQYAFQTPHLYGPSGANLTTLPQAYGGAGTIPTSTPTAGSVTYL
jgi:hypothetical protein